jgi:predicted dinucleotide-binding enzyme
VDVSNPSGARDGDALAKWVDEQGGAGLATAKLLPGSHIVRAFNNFGHNGIHGNEVLTNPPPGQTVGVPIAGDDAQAIALATRLFKETRFEPVLIGGLAKGKYLVPGSVISGVHTPEELRKIAASLT